MGAFCYHFHLTPPFNDSTGRVRRLVASSLPLKAGSRELMIPPDDRTAYLDALAAVDSTVPADKLAALYPGLDPLTLVTFLGTCVEATLQEMLGIIEGRVALPTADVAEASKRERKAFLTRLKQASPG